jgi:hypothetical protein
VRVISSNYNPLIQNSYIHGHFRTPKWPDFSHCYRNPYAHNKQTSGDATYYPLSSTTVSSTSQTTPTQTATRNPNTGIERLAIGLGLGLGLPFVALAFFFCCSYRRISISVKIMAPEPPPAYSDANGRFVRGRAVGELNSEEDGSAAKKNEMGGEASVAVGYK